MRSGGICSQGSPSPASRASGSPHTTCSAHSANGVLSLGKLLLLTTVRSLTSHCLTLHSLQRTGTQETWVIQSIQTGALLLIMATRPVNVELWDFAPSARTLQPVLLLLRFTEEGNGAER